MTEQTFGPTRRIVFQGLGALGTAIALAGCGGDDDGDEDGGGGGGAGSPEAGKDLSAVSGVPVGGGVILLNEKIVITQPTEGEFNAFSAVCTHQSCTVAEVTQTIDCTCHGSKFSVEDGSVQGGPAPSPLPRVDIEVDGDRIVTA